MDYDGVLKYFSNPQETGTSSQASSHSKPEHQKVNINNKQKSVNSSVGVSSFLFSSIIYAEDFSTAPHCASLNSTLTRARRNKRTINLAFGGLRRRAFAGIVGVSVSFLELSQSPPTGPSLLCVYYTVSFSNKSFCRLLWIFRQDNAWNICWVSWGNRRSKRANFKPHCPGKSNKTNELKISAGERIDHQFTIIDVHRILLAIY